MNTSYPFTRDLVLIGGGHTHALVLRKWGMNPLPGVRLTLIDPAPAAAYSGMLPGFVAGHYSRSELDIDLVQLARFAGARLILGAVNHIDRDAREIHVPGRPPIAYDTAAIDIGITSAMPALSGFSDHGTPAKPLTPFARKWEAFCTSDTPKRLAVIGGGVAGAELAMAMAHALTQDGQTPEISLIDRSRILTEATPQGGDKLRAALQRLGVEIIENATASKIAADHVTLADGTTIPSHFTVGAAGAKPHDWQANIGLETQDGFLTVTPTLQTSDPDIFATGDCAHLAHAPRTKAGVYAVRQAPVLFDNLAAHLSGGSLRRYDPQKDYLKLISLGGKSALAEKWGRAISGPLLWKWKNRIDQAFMHKFKDLPEMEGPSLPRTHADGLAEVMSGAPLCGGCGAKVARGPLRDALSGDVTLGDDAAILTTGAATQVISTDHLRAFTDDPVLMTRIAAIHALGDIWAMGAKPQAATITLILPRMTPELQGRTLAEINAVAREVLGNAGAKLVGGHTSMGAEMTVGFTLTGICTRAPITLAGAKPGDAVVLTKPIGSGVILAAEMKRVAPGDTAARCYGDMVHSQGTASMLLADAHAMTDVTGFGLAGHLAGMAEASGADIQIDLTAVPLMDGALDLAMAGIGSSLLPDNRSGAVGVTCPDGPLGDLMYDPQTAGGLLAAVDAGQADDLVLALEKAGYPAARIGQVSPGAGHVVFA